MKRILIILALLLLLGTGSIVRLFPSYSSVLESNWDVSLPVKAVLTEVYSKQTEDSFHGDGIRYHIYSYRYEDYIDLMFAWSSNERKTIYYSSLSETASAWLDEIEVPITERPKYYACSNWYRSQSDNSEIIIFWDSEINMLYIIESFI
ncbi:MAG: hypothetical protein E7191_06540 [Erysipelotrichaceae bacterium]|nr:hypothetical protein [Erysipelotrichaceae bacterium]